MLCAVHVTCTLHVCAHGVLCTRVACACGSAHMYGTCTNTHVWVWVWVHTCTDPGGGIQAAEAHTLSPRAVWASASAGTQSPSRGTRSCHRRRTSVIDACPLSWGLSSTLRDFRASGDQKNTVGGRGVDGDNFCLKDHPSRWTEVKGEDRLLLTWGVGDSGFGACN